MYKAMRNESFWLGLLGGVLGAFLVQAVTLQPWAQAGSNEAVVTSGSSPQGDPSALTSEKPPPGEPKRDGRGAAPRLIPFQGYLTDTAGRPVEGPHTLAFALYDDPTQGSVLWTETHTGVPVTKGLVNVVLGGATPFGSLTFDAARYVGVRVDGGLELVPRQQVLPAVYAADSDRAKDALRLVTPGTLDPAVTVDAVGNVGIGTSAPDVRLDVVGNGAPATVWIDGLDSTNSTLYLKDPLEYSLIQSGNHLRFRMHDGVSFTDQVTITRSGNVGIGTTTPESRLHVEQGGVTIRETFYAPANAWTAIESNPNVAGFYIVVVLKHNAWSQRRMYMVLFTGYISSGVNHVLLDGSTYLGYAPLTAEFEHYLEGGAAVLKIRPSEDADVMVTKIRTMIQ